MIIISPSVKHCGHHFLRYRILEPYFTGWPPHTQIPYEDKNYCLYGHFEHNNTNNFNTLWNNYGGMTTAVIPLRHPARVLESYRRRSTVQSREGEFMQEWRYMMDITQNFKDVWWFHLDDNDLREEQAHAIQFDLLGQAVDIDWSVNKKTGSKKDTHDLTITNELLKDIPQSFIDFYEEKKQWT